MTTETPTDDTTTDAVDTTATTALGDAANADPAADAADPGAVTADDKSGEADGGDDGESGETSDEVSIIGAPEAYDVAAFAMPEGVEFDSELFDLVKDDLKGMDLSQKGAEQVIALFASKVAPKIAERTAKGIDDAGVELSANLARDLQADPEVGGSKLRESQAYAAKAIAQFIPDPATRSEFSKFLNESGLGNHPLLTRVIAGAGRALSEASVPPGEGATTPLTAAEKFYGRKAQ